MDDWTSFDAYMIVATGGTNAAREHVVARFAFEDDARAFLASIRRRKSWNTYRLEHSES